MNFSVLDTEIILLLTAGVIGAELALFALLLRRRGLFRWNGAGFWAWAAFLLYFVVNPTFSALTGTTVERYDLLLTIAGGAERALWILLVLVVGIACFFWAYLRAPAPGPSNWRLPTRTLSLPGLIVLVTVVSFGLYALVTYRTFLSVEGIVIESGRFVGDVTGYETSGYNFLFLPIAYLLIARRRALRALGWILVGAFFVLSLPHGWSRYTVISLIVLVTVALVCRRQRRWPPVSWIALLVVAAAVLQVRGHDSLTYQAADEFLLQATAESAQNLGDVLAARDAAMLATFYLDSYLHDTLIGFEYGIPILNYALTGWIPNRLFPEKYFLVDWLEAQQGAHPGQITAYLTASKSSLLGDLYRNGWILAVALGAYALGLLSRRLDGWLLSDSHPMVQAAGIGIMSHLWMIWASDMPWGMVRVGYIVMPALLVWVVWQIDPVQRRARHLSKSSSGMMTPPGN